MVYLAPRGTADLLPPAAARWQGVEGVIRELCFVYGYGEIRTPIFEHTELFARGIGEGTDIVEKEMYTFTDRGGRSITLRPEGTAPVVRAFLEHNLANQGLPVKLYYFGPMFRYERPQAGRLREFHQFGVEVFGTDDPASDAEVMALAFQFYQRLGLKDLKVQLNSLGCRECRPRYREVVAAYAREVGGALCASCQARLERNPLRLLDCKRHQCREALAGAPAIDASLCSECAAHLEAVQEALRLFAVPTQRNPRLVRGFDYYTRTVFEITAEGLGAQDAIGGGGRYNSLVEELGGKPTPAVGFAAGIERVFLALEAQGVNFPEPQRQGVFVASLGEAARAEALRLVGSLRTHGVRAELDYQGRGLKGQLKAADKAGVARVVILGEEELARQVATVRELATGKQVEVALAEVLAYLTER